MTDNATPTDAERQAADAVPIVDALLWEISCRKACNLQDIIDDDEIYTELYATLVTLAAPHIANARQAGRQEMRETINKGFAMAAETFEAFAGSILALGANNCGIAKVFDKCAEMAENLTEAAKAIRALKETK